MTRRFPVESQNLCRGILAIVWIMLGRIRAVSCGVLLAARLAVAAVPVPEAHFGHKIGAARTVLDWGKVVSYFRLLERSSDRLRVEELGKSTDGRPFIVATISAPETLRNLDRYRQIQAKLADPRSTTAAEAEGLIAA